MIKHEISDKFLSLGRLLAMPLQLRVLLLYYSHYLQRWYSNLKNISWLNNMDHRHIVFSLLYDTVSFFNKREAFWYEIGWDRFYKMSPGPSIYLKVFRINI